MIEEKYFYNFVTIITTCLDKDVEYHNKTCSLIWTEGDIDGYTDNIVYFMGFKHDGDLVHTYFLKLGSVAKIDEESITTSLDVFDQKAEFQSFLVRAQ